MDNFDVHEWNKNRYLNGIKEGMGPKQATMKLDQLTFDVVKSMFGKIPMFGLGFPNADDSYRSVFNEKDLESWKDSIRDRFGNVNIRIDVEAASKWEQVKILDDKFIDDKKSYIDRKGRALDNWRKDSNYGLDEDINEYSKYDNIASYGYKGYKDKHFDICPAAEGLRDRLLAGEFKDNKWATGTNFEKEVGEWLYRHDILFQIEKQVLRDKEGDQSDVEDAKKAVGRIVNLSRDLGIPASEISYLKAHLKKIKDIVEYSSLTEKEDDEFAGSDPKAGSTIQGTGFDWKKKDSIKETIKFIMDNLQGYSNYFPGGKTKGLSSDEMSTILMQIAKDIEDDGMQLDESNLCKRGRNYLAARKRAGEKSSAYLSGRAVKVCKGQIKGSDGKKKKSY